MVVKAQSVSRTATPYEWAIVGCLLLILEYELDVEALRLAAAYRDAWDSSKNRPPNPRHDLVSG